jgi:hypothetical protein
MKVPHRGGRGARSRARRKGLAMAVEEEIAPRKSGGCKFACGASQSAPEVIIRVGVVSRKSRAAVAQDRGDLSSGRAPLEQFLGDPLIGDAPVGLWEAFPNPQTAQPTGIDLGRSRRRDRRVGMWRHCRRQVWKQRRARRVAQPMLGRFQQGGALGRQAGAGVQHLHPWRVAAPVSVQWFLIGETGQAAQMTPIGAGRVAAIEAGQLFPDPSGHSGFDRHDADLHPSLEVTGAGLEYRAGIVTSGAHGFHDGAACMVQIHEDITRIAFRGVGLDVNVAALPIAHAQKSYRSRMDQLGGGPQPLSWKSPLGGWWIKRIR